MTNLHCKSSRQDILVLLPRCICWDVRVRWRQSGGDQDKNWTIKGIKPRGVGRFKSYQHMSLSTATRCSSYSSWSSPWRTEFRPKGLKAASNLVCIRNFYYFYGSKTSIIAFSGECVPGSAVLIAREEGKLLSIGDCPHLSSLNFLKISNWRQRLSQTLWGY